MKYSIYIGSNNKTKKLEKAKIHRIINKFYDGYSATEIRGYWKGIPEETMKIEILDGNDKKIKEMASILGEELHQEAVLVEKISNKIAFI